MREPDAPADTAERLAQELRLMADWLGLEEVAIARRGDLAPTLADCVMRALGASAGGKTYEGSRTSSASATAAAAIGLAAFRGRDPRWPRVKDV